MSRLLKVSVAAVFIAGVVAAGPAVAQKKAELHLVIGTTYGKAIPMGHMFRYLVKPRLEKYSNGRISVDLKQQKKLCAEHKCIEQVKLGQIDIGASSSGNMGAFGTTFNINFLPYIFKTDSYAAKVLAGWHGEYLRKQARKEMGLHLLGSYVGGAFRSLDNSVREVRVPADLKGIKIRVTKSPVEFTLIKAWGGVPIPYDWVQLYQGLQTGVINGQYVQLPWQDLYKMYEVQQHYTVMGGAWGGNVIYMHEKRVQKLPGWAREALQKAMDDFVVAALANDAAWVKEGTARIKAKVETFYTPNAAEQAKWLAGAVQAWKGAKGTYDAGIAKKALKEQGLMEFLAKLEKAGAL